MKTLVIRIKGLTDDEIQEELSEFFNNMTEKHVGFGAGISIMTENTEEEKTILDLADLK